MKTEQIIKAYEMAKERYAALGINTDKAIEILEKTPISLHCWQADDVVGFERNVAASGGIQTTGNYPGKARNIDELRQDIEKVKSLCFDLRSRKRIAGIIIISSTSACLASHSSLL